jgi:hypothetical protein
MINLGFGCQQFNLAVYIANRPNMLEYQDLSQLTSLTKGEISAIGQACGNGWRKVFNVYAKLLYALAPADFSFSKSAPSWQQYRDDYLLQQHSHTALLFTPPILEKSAKTLHIICGRTYAKHLLATGKLAVQFKWLDDEFAIDKTNNIIVCPYFDYRQLSNVKIERLAKLLNLLKNQRSRS